MRERMKEREKCTAYLGRHSDGNGRMRKILPRLNADQVNACIDVTDCDREEEKETGTEAHKTQIQHPPLLTTWKKKDRIKKRD